MTIEITETCNLVQGLKPRDHQAVRMKAHDSGLHSHGHLHSTANVALNMTHWMPRRIVLEPNEKGDGLASSPPLGNQNLLVAFQTLSSRRNLKEELQSGEVDSGGRH